jgi:phosphomannomutase
MKGAVVQNIAGTSLLSRIAEKYKLKLYETPVGFKHISRLMQKKNILIGGEEAGGIGFKNYIPERDGILAGLLLLEMLIAQKKTLEDLLEDMEDEFGKYVYLRKDIKCRPQEKPKVTSRLARMRGKKTFSGSKVNRIDDYDGLKFYLSGNSWILFRLSGTEPILRVYAEAESAAKAKKLINEGVKALSLR